MTPAQPAIPILRVLRGEVLLSIFINILFNMTFAWLLFPRDEPVHLWGVGALAMDMIPATFMPALMMTLGMTAGLRGRLRRGMTVRGAIPVPAPRLLIVRALGFAVLALCIVALPTVGLLAALWGDPWTWNALIVFKLFYSCLLACIITPIIVLAALHVDAPKIRSLA